MIPLHSLCTSQTCELSLRLQQATAFRLLLQLKVDTDSLMAGAFGSSLASQRSWPAREIRSLALAVKKLYPHHVVLCSLLCAFPLQIWSSGDPSSADSIMTDDIRYVDLLWVEETTGRSEFKSMIKTIFKVRQNMLLHCSVDNIRLSLFKWLQCDEYSAGHCAFHLICVHMFRCHNIHTSQHVSMLLGCSSNMRTCTSAGCPTCALMCSPALLQINM